MKSPFPGLDPYLETFWSNVHTSMMTYLRDQLQRQLPEGLWARVEETITIDVPEEGRTHQAVPDVHVTEEPSWRQPWSGKEEPGGTALADPIVIPADEPITGRHIEIVDTRSKGRVVTAIKVLGPSNKRNEHLRQLYRQKQRDFIMAGVSLVEIDLIRSGNSVLSVPFDHIPEGKRSGHLICVYRASSARPGWEVYPVSLRQPLPTFRLPLRETDEDARLDLQAVLDQCYENGGYERGIDYTGPPDPPLPEADRQWAEALLREKGVRP